jgi:hypothetical protein
MTNICPNCGYCQAVTAAVKPAPVKRKATTKEETIIRNGGTWYGRLVNYTTGARMSFASFPDNGKDWRPKWVRDLRRMRDAGNITPARDWLDDYPRIKMAMIQQGFFPAGYSPTH